MDPSFILGESSAAMTENCINGIDDDMDGMIDLNDPDCACQVIDPVSLIPNPSFEDQECCPNDRSQLDCASVWIQASEPTTDYIHTCDWLGWSDFPPPMPFPDGEGIMGFRDGRVRGGNQGETNWKEYAGACLLSPLLAGETYRFEFDVGFVSTLRSPPIEITFFGTTDCDNLPFGQGNEAFGCPSNDPEWVKLGSTNVSGDGQSTWVKANIDVVTTEDITAIAIGPSCDPVNVDVSIYYFFDNLLLADIRAFNFQIKEIEHPCQDEYAMRIPDNSNFDYQWYKDGIALVGETTNEVSGQYGEGKYQVRIDDGSQCLVAKGFDYAIPEFNEQVIQPICKEDTYQFGDLELSQPGTYIDTFKNVNNCDSIVMLDLRIIGVDVDTVQAQIFEGETFQYEGSSFRKEGDYPLTLTSSLGCDSLVLLELDFYEIYIPNAFSPNADGTNDSFIIFDGSNVILEYELAIYDRWGSEVYRGLSWDGTHKGEPVNSDTYVYSASVQMIDGVQRQFNGSVVLIR